MKPRLYRSIRFSVVFASVCEIGFRCVSNRMLTLFTSTHKVFVGLNLFVSSYRHIDFYIVFGKLA